MRGALRAVAYGWETVYTRNRELYSSQWFAAEELARPTWRRIRTS